jgi:isovaleryl-CoA dehydrogenase
MYPDADVPELQESVRRFAEAEVAPLARSVDRNDRFPRDLWPKLGAMVAWTLHELRAT